MIRHAKTAMLAGVDARLLAYAERNQIFITAGRDGRHNPGSKHPLGQAIDFRSRGLTSAFIGHLQRDALAHGLHLIDERQRPAPGRVWSAPHFHVEVND